MKFLRGARRDNLFNSVFSASQRLSFNLYEIVICANKLSLSFAFLGWSVPTIFSATFRYENNYRYSL